MVFDKYLFRSLGTATVFIAVTLAGIIFLTQSLRFLELVINSGASGTAFFLLTLLALPRFFEIILPIALTAAILFTYNKMTIDSEIVVMRALGTSPLALARPALALSGIVMVVLFIMTAWLGPVTLANMQHLRQVIKAQYSSFFFREGIFNAVGSGLTIFVRERAGEGELLGLMIHDNRPVNDTPVTIIAKRGILVATDEGQQVIVYDGSRQGYDPETGNLSSLDFSRYTIDLPEAENAVRQRWREPDERTLLELFNPDPANAQDLNSRRAFRIEANRRIVSPFLAPAFAVVALISLLLGPIDRRGLGRRIAVAISSVILMEGLYLAAFNMSQHTVWGLILMYGLIFIPLGAGLYLLHPASEKLQHKLLYHMRRRVK